MSSLDPFEILFLVCFFALPVWGVIDAAQIPAPAWEKAGRSKQFWVLVQLLTLYIGSLMYLAGVRRDVLFFTAPPDPEWDEVDLKK